VVSQNLALIAVLPDPPPTRGFTGSLAAVIPRHNQASRPLQECYNTFHGWIERPVRLATSARRARAAGSSAAGTGIDRAGVDRASL